MGRLTPVITDPTGDRYGIPTYRWKEAPKHLMTRRQLAAAGLRKGGQSPVAEMRIYVEGWQVAYLYDSTTAPKRRPWTPAKQEAVQKAADSRKWCDKCGEFVGYVPRGGVCNACEDGTYYPADIQGGGVRVVPENRSDRGGPNDNPSAAEDAA